MRGCNKFCSYCIVPFVRGPERSRDPDQIFQEVHRLVDAGRSEITLLGQTVNSYRFRTGERTVRFSDLLERLSGVAGLRRLRFVTSHPVDFGDDILEAIRDLPPLCEYIHLPAQSGSDPVLKRMRRRYTRGQYDDLVDRARAIVPGVVLAGDFIVGFPGEGEQDHVASADLIRRSGYKNSFIFKYSPRPGTWAGEHLKDDVPTEVKKRRNNELLTVQGEVGLEHHQAYVTRTVEILVEGPSPRVDKQAAKPTPGAMQLVGRTRGDHIVVFDAPENLIGQYVDVRITAATALTLFGELPDPYVR
jgi:tRNA-2-methylthio-N6-dimethylallyladenosine synthase